MTRQSWKILAAIGVFAIVLAILNFPKHNRGGELTGDVPVVIADTELVLPWDSPFGNSEEAAKECREVGIELSRRPVSGPIRCVLRAVPGAITRGEPQVEVEWRNTTSQPVSIQAYRFLIDTVTFIIRDSEETVLSSFCHVFLHSDFGGVPGPPVILGPLASQSDKIWLSTACYGFQASRPGRYTLEVVFHQ